MDRIYYRFPLIQVILITIILTQGCTTTRSSKSLPFNSFDISTLDQPFSLQLISGEIVPVRFNDMLLAEINNNSYIIYYKSGETLSYPLAEIKSVRFDVIDKKSQREKEVNSVLTILGIAAAVGVVIVLGIWITALG